MLVLVFLLLLSVPAWADDQLDQAHNVCVQHQLKAPASTYQPGWESCVQVEQDWIASVDAYAKAHPHPAPPTADEIAAGAAARDAAAKAKIQQHLAR